MESTNQSPNNNEVVTITAPDGHSETVDLSIVKPLNDPNCQHEWAREDGEPDIANTYTEICRKCPVGRIVRDPGLA